MKVIISSSPELLDDINELLGREETAESLKGIKGSIKLMGLRTLRPAFPDDAQIKYLKSMGIPMPEVDTYRIYIGKEVQSVIEKHGGVELPIDILDDFERFREEVLVRVLAVLGSTSIHN